VNDENQDESVACYVGLGSNLDQPEIQVKKAIDQLNALPSCHIGKRSSLYLSAPVDDRDQPEFINVVCLVYTTLSARRLLDQLLQIELSHGRMRTADRPKGPRCLDLDLLLYGELQIDEPDLIVPHPRMHQRLFVLLPLSEIAPKLYIPGRGVVYDLINQHDVRDQQVKLLSSDT